MDPPWLSASKCLFAQRCDTSSASGSVLCFSGAVYLSTKHPRGCISALTMRTFGLRVIQPNIAGFFLRADCSGCGRISIFFPCSQRIPLELTASAGCILPPHSQHFTGTGQIQRVNFPFWASLVSQNSSKLRLPDPAASTRLPLVSSSHRTGCTSRFSTDKSVNSDLAANFITRLTLSVQDTEMGNNTGRWQQLKGEDRSWGLFPSPITELVS